MKFVGIEPMVKPAAAMSKAHHIAVFATPATLSSARYNELKETWAKNTIIDEPDCSSWAGLIEAGKKDDVPLEETLETELQKGADVIVLACTHYHWLKDRAEKIAGSRATILEPSDAISRRIASIVG